MILSLFQTKNVFAQSPTTTQCEGATLVNIEDECQFLNYAFETDMEEYWISFIAESVNSEIEFESNSLFNSANLNSIELYSGFCGGLISDTNFNVTYNNVYSLNGLTPGETYF